MNFWCEQAQATLTKAVEAQRELPALNSRDLGSDREDVLAACLFLREAQALIPGKAAAPAAKSE
jgi:hypothetical protein